MIYGTYLGGSGYDRGSNIAVDTAGEAHVIGFTYSSDFPTVNALQAASGGSTDAFVFKLSPDGASLVYSTYLGGSKAESLSIRMGITVDLAGATYVTGATQSHDFPTVNALQPEIGGPLCRAGQVDAFVVKITEDSLTSSTAGANLASTPTNDSISSTKPGGGGGAMDVLILSVLAQLAVAGALRRRNRRGQ